MKCQTQNQPATHTHHDGGAPQLLDLTLETRAARGVLLDLRVHGRQLAVELLELARQVQNALGERAILVAQLRELGLWKSRQTRAQTWIRKKIMVSTPRKQTR